MKQYIRKLFNTRRLTKTISSADIEAARKAYRSGDIVSVRENLEPLRVHQPDNGAVVLLARAEYELGVPETAQAIIDDFLKIKPSHKGALCLAGELKLARGDIPAAEKLTESIRTQSPDTPPSRRIQSLITEAQNRERATELITEIDSAYPDALGGEVSAPVREAAGELAKLDPGKNWTKDVTLAKIAFFANAINLDHALRNYHPHLIQKSVDFDYVTWPRRIQEFIKHKSVIDVGCGFGAFGTGFMIAGAKSYFGLDPAMPLDSSRAKNKRIRQWDELGITPREIVQLIPDIELHHGTAEDLSEHRTFDTISLHNVTEHLINLETVISGLVPLCHSGSRLIYLHHNYYCWNGHHVKPNQPAQLDMNNDKHLEVYDWRHIDALPTLPEDHNFMTGLNRVRLDEIHEITQKYFEIQRWDELDSNKQTLERLTPDILDRVRKTIPDLTERDLQVNTVFCVARPKTRSSTPIASDESSIYRSQSFQKFKPALRPDGMRSQSLTRNVLPDIRLLRGV